MMHLQSLSRNFLECLSKTLKHSGDIRSPGRNLNNEPSEYEAELCVLSGLRRGINEICAVLRCYAV
jgi:hypothetical protein